MHGGSLLFQIKCLLRGKWKNLPGGVKPYEKYIHGMYKQSVNIYAKFNVVFSCQNHKVLWFAATLDFQELVRRPFRPSFEQKSSSSGHNLLP